MTESIMCLIIAVAVTIYSMVRSAQTWQGEGVHKVFSIIFAILAVAMAKNAYLGFLELIQ